MKHNASLSLVMQKWQHSANVCWFLCWAFMTDRSRTSSLDCTNFQVRATADVGSVVKQNPLCVYWEVYVSADCGGWLWLRCEKIICCRSFDVWNQNGNNCRCLVVSDAISTDVKVFKFKTCRSSKHLTMSARSPLIDWIHPGLSMNPQVLRVGILLV